MSMQQLLLDEDPEGKKSFLLARDDDADVYVRIGIDKKWIAVLLDEGEAGQLHAWLTNWLVTR